MLSRWLKIPSGSLFGCFISENVAETIEKNNCKAIDNTIDAIGTYGTSRKSCCRARTIDSIAVFHGSSPSKDSSCRLTLCGCIYYAHFFHYGLISSIAYQSRVSITGDREV